MSEAELIARQQMEIEELKQDLGTNVAIKNSLHGEFYSIGAPLNDNILGFNKEQLQWVGKVYFLIEKIRTLES